VELPARREQEFDRARAEVAHRACGGGGRLAHAAAQLRRHRHGGRLLDELLVTSLDAALALPQRDHPAEGIRQDLDLDVARPLEVLLEIDFIRPERLARFARRRFESRLELGFLSDQPHALAAASRRRPEEHRIPDPARHRLEALLVAGADDAQRDLAAVRDQYALDGRWHYFRHVGTSAATLNVAIASHSVGVARAARV